MSREHRIPAVERAIAVLDALALHREGMALPELARTCGSSRSTTYRLLTSMEEAGLVRRGEAGRHLLGPRLLGLAAAALAGMGVGDVVACARPHLERLSAVTGEASKLSVLDQGQALCIDAVAGANPYALSPRTAQWFPLHAGAASKVLLAAMPAAAREAVVVGPLERFSDRTICDAEGLSRELESVIGQGWAEDRGEHSPSVCALAAPIVGGDGAVVATVSMAYVAERHDRMKRHHLDDLRRCCADIGVLLAAAPSARGPAPPGPVGRAA
ncbi:MAG TPA: IclR family transcriptional regulator [Geminicoccaceae bacterium]|nr:IclR family transcriptional regulator [Geminicoccus sp.]HMU51534.1 IclR family transcriptional regulator [Geminicoccaceae bacterium]